VTNGTRQEDPAVQTRTSIPSNASINGVFAVLQGVKANDPLMGGYGYLQWSNAGNAWHEGLDLNSMGGGNADLGANVVAPLDGEVTFTGHWDGWTNGFGNHVAMWIDDPRAADPCFMHVAHLDRINVARGQRVSAGQSLGTCGRSGNQPYAHAHTAQWWQPPPGNNWGFWQTGYSREWVAERTLDPEAWFWASVTKAGGYVPPPEAVMVLTDWQIANWIMPELWNWAGIPYNPESGTSRGWIAALRDGHYLGRPRTAERPYGEGDDAGVWVEYENGLGVYRLRDDQYSWTG
jgi:hypothetical protein